MIEQFLSNTNESATVFILQKKIRTKQGTSPFKAQPGELLFFSLFRLLPCFHESMWFFPPASSGCEL